MRVLVLVTGLFLFLSSVAAQRAGSRPTGTGATGVTGRAGEVRKRIETSRGTCECVPYYDCNTDDTVDTTIFRIRLKRQIEARPEQCEGLYVCCLVNKGSNNNNNNNNNNGGENNNSNNNNGDKDNNNSNNNNNNNNNGENSSSSSEEDEKSCICLPSYQCGKNDTEVFKGGKGIITPKLQCEGNEVLCCDKSFGGGGPKPAPKPNHEIPSTCGTRKNIDFNINRIQTAGDGSTMFGEYPWMLVILKSETMDDGTKAHNVFVCGASLIQPSIAITAAHCVHRSRPHDLKVRAGEWDTREDNAAEVLPYQEQRVEEIILHPRFNNATLHNDVAVLRLKSPFKLEDNVGLICLPDERSHEPSKCIATGWGKEAFTKDSKYQNIMKQVALPYVPSSDCQSKLRTTRLGNYFILDKSFVCAGGKSNEDTCQGDGGGPLSCIVDGDERFYLIGITSWGIGCGTKNVPGVYTNVKLFSDWISSHLQ